ncbi:MAG: amino acid adenylation domain-containing protein [Bacteroidales bacterium]|nr:amino acid adenylation domain-containing protein [Bacteroidales bacterium]
MSDINLADFALQGNTNTSETNIEEVKLHDIAIIGISLRFPLANSLKEFDNNLSNGVECIMSYPNKRETFSTKYLRLKNVKESYIKYLKGCYLNDIDSFDNEFFGIPPREASLMDPNQRVFLQVAWEALEDGGYGGKKLSNTRTGVYVGFTPNTQIFDYRQVVADLEYDKISIAIPGNLTSMMPSRLAYFLDLKGPSLMIDTACSSSLVAIHLACKGLRSGECDYAIAGSVNLNIFPVEKFGNLGVESSDGHTRTFDDNANGTGIGEGAAAILLKPLHKAIEDRDEIYAVIKGSAINQDGTSAGITAPNGKAQEDVMLKAWEDANIEPQTIQYIEAHGTGTIIGDPIEVQSISNAFSVYTNKKQFCAIGSVKPNIGHLYASAGIASLIKVVMSLQNKKLYPSINFKTPNRNINFSESAVFVNNELKAWNNGSTPRRCGINAFGFSGTNCHLVLEEAPILSKKDSKVTLETEIFTLSTKNTSVLANIVQNYIKYLNRNLENTSISIQDICYTANIGRGQYDVRLAMLVKSKKELLEKLANFDFENINTTDKSIFFGSANLRNTENIRELTKKAESAIADMSVNNKNYKKLASELCGLFVKGAEVGWDKIYLSNIRYRQHLPFYAFSKTDCTIVIPESLPDNEVYNHTVVKMTSDSTSKRPTITVTLIGNSENVYSDFEKQVGQVWCDVIGYKTIDINENFFHLGGESITLMQIVQRLSEIYDMHLTMEDFVNNATIKGLATFIINNQGKTKRIVYPQQIADAANIYEPFPLTEIQVAYLIGRDKNFELGGIGTHIYAEVESTFDIPRLNLALNKVIARHPMLRAVFIPETQKQQILKNAPSYTIAYSDISSLNESAQKEKILKERERMSHHVFDPKSWPLFELTAFKLAENKNYLFFGYDMLIADGLSIQIFENEVVNFYHNPDENLPSLDFTFRDYMLAYENFKQSEHYNIDKEFHAQHLDELPFGPSLLTSVALSKVSKPLFNRKQKVFDKESWNKLKSVARSMQVTPSALILTIYAKVLNFWSSEDRFTINLTVFNRYPFNKEINKLIGDFTSVILMNLDFSNNKDLNEHIKDTNLKMMEALSHRHYDGVSVIRELARRHNTGTKALMPVVFTSMLIDEKTSDFELTERLGTFTYGVSQTSQVYLDNQLTENNGQLSITWDYEQTVFDAKIIDTMFAQYMSIIDAIIDERPVEKLSVNEHDKALIAKYNDTSKKLAIDTLDNLFYNNVSKYGNNIAVKSDISDLTYNELNKKSNKIAHYLLEQGVGNNTCVAVIAHRQPETIAYMMGVLKAGGTYVPIEPDYPEDRRGYIMENSKATIILDADTFDLKNIDKYSSENVTGYSKLDALAYIIYTSGSTGKPKGVMITHKAAVNTILDINQRFAITADDRILGLSSMCFDLSVYDIFGALSTGASMFIVPDIKNTEKISDIIAEHQITFWNSVPSVMNLMVENLSINENRKFVKYLSLRNVLMSGDWIPVDLPRKIKGYFPNAAVTSLGGATEGSIWSIYYPINEVSPTWKSIPYGYPLLNQKFYVLNKDLDFCPVGVEGELFIGGDGVASGYLNDKEKTEKAFIQHPNLGYIYRTGDYGIFHKEGYIEFMGRKDAQVKIRGHRIELGEIESNLLQHGGVNQSIALITELEPGDKKIVAYVTPSYLVDWDYEYTGNLLPNKQKYLRLPFTSDVELIISGNSYKTSALDISSMAITLNGSYDSDNLIEVLFTIPGANQRTRVKSEIIILTQDRCVLLFNDSSEVINDIQSKLDDYKMSIPFELLNEEFKKLEFKLEEQCKIKLSSGTILECNIRQLTHSGVALTGITEEVKTEKGSVDIEFIITGLVGSITIPGLIEWTKENVAGIRFTKSNQTTEILTNLIINYSEVSGISTQVLKDHLKNKVPDYMMPYAFIQLDYIPLTANQKVDRKKLPNPSTVQEVSKANNVAPQNAIERKIFEMWKEILKTDSFGIYNNFFELGGDSLQIYQVAMRAEAEYKIKIPIDSLYKEPTIANISLFIRDVLEKSGQTIPMEEIVSTGSTDLVYFWVPGASWNLADNKVVINESVYDAADLFPKFYFLTQQGCSVNTLLQEFKGKDESKIKKVVDWLIGDGILVNTITSWHKVYAPHKKLFNNTYDKDLLFDKTKYNRFKETQMAREFDGGLNVSLELINDKGSLPITLSERRSYRNFNEQEIIPFTSFSTLLSVFKQHKNANGEYTYYYASSGALYPIDIYIYVKENRVENVREGLYYYHPATHKLNLISKEKITETSAYVKNKEIFKSSAITMYMVFNAEACMPVYAASGYYWATIDAGVMIGSLTQVAETCNMGLCSIGDMNFDVIKDLFKLNKHQVLLHNIELGIKPQKALTYNEVVEVYEQAKNAN